jgi:hypothetical protein
MAKKVTKKKAPKKKVETQDEKQYLTESEMRKHDNFCHEVTIAKLRYDKKLVEMELEKKERELELAKLASAYNKALSLKMKYAKDLENRVGGIISGFDPITGEVIDE